jgi:hypothetical protein
LFHQSGQHHPAGNTKEERHVTTKLNRGEQAASSRHWRNKRYFLTDEYKAAQREMIVTHKKLSAPAMKISLVILNRFKHTPKIHANLEGLAAECGMTRKTLSKYLAEIAKRKLFHFRTPDYNSRGAAKATEISFPTFNVRKWLRHSDNLKSMGNFSTCFSGSTNEIRHNLKSMGKNYPPYQEVAASPRAAGADAPRAATLEQANHSGTKPTKPTIQLKGFLVDDNGKQEWFPATMDRSEGAPEIHTVMRLDDGQRCTIMGYSMNEETLGHLLVDLPDEEPGDLFWQRIGTLQAEPGELLGYRFADYEGWFPATADQPDGLPKLGAVMRFEDGQRCRILGYPLDEEATEGCVLVEMIDGVPSDGWRQFWAEVADLEAEPSDDDDFADDEADDFEDEDEDEEDEPAPPAKPTKPIPPKGTIVEMFGFSGRFIVGEPLENGHVKIYRSEGDRCWMEAHPNQLKVISAPEVALPEAPSEVARKSSTKRAAAELLRQLTATLSPCFSAAMV